MQKRSPAKDTFPGRYDSSASGHLASGEDYDACAVRELQEELGLNVLPVELKKRFKIAACSQTGWEFVWVYTIHGDYRPVINPAEITSAEYRPVRRIRTAIVEQPELWAPSFIMVFQEMDRRGLLPVTG